MQAEQSGFREGQTGAKQPFTKSEVEILKKSATNRSELTDLLASNPLTTATKQQAFEMRDYGRNAVK
jgi:hypothetical protein